MGGGAAATLAPLASALLMFRPRCSPWFLVPGRTDNTRSCADAAQALPKATLMAGPAAIQMARRNVRLYVRPLLPLSTLTTFAF